jgi:hypothetical protein
VDQQVASGHLHITMKLGVSLMQTVAILPLRPRHLPSLCSPLAVKEQPSLRILPQFLGRVGAMVCEVLVFKLRGV